MIFTINGSERHKYPDLVKAMYKLRAEVFSDRLGWDVQVTDGLEIDCFDDVDPLYVMSLDEKGNLKGSLRLLPTTGPNMLRDVFSVLLRPDEEVYSPLIWESTRFCVTKEAQVERSLNKLNRTTGELLLGAFELAEEAGIATIMSVYDAHMRRILQMAGCHAIPVGLPTKIGKVTTYAGLFEVGEEVMSRVRAASGITGSVLAPDHRRIAA